jgi:hypothetical protein
MSNSKIVELRKVPLKQYTFRDALFEAEHVTGHETKMVRTRVGCLAAFPGEFIVYYRQEPIMVLMCDQFNDLFVEKT